jgi:hypothetical protein
VWSSGAVLPQFGGRGTAPAASRGDAIDVWLAGCRNYFTALSGKVVTQVASAAPGSGSAAASSPLALAPPPPPTMISSQPRGGRSLGPLVSVVVRSVEIERDAEDERVDRRTISRFRCLGVQEVAGFGLVEPSTSACVL